MNVSLLRSIAIAIALPVFLHAHLLLGFAIPDPAVSYADLSINQRGWLSGRPAIDPNYGYIDQSLTAQAAHTILHGELPWWNPLEAFGTPLAGEMQSSALFPFSVLIAAPGGSLALMLLMQIFAGIAMLLLLRKCGIAPWAALVGGLLYEHAGTFAWLPGAWSYSLPWLPLAALGVDYLRSRTTRDMLAGTLVLAVATGLLVTSGFIETSYLEGLALLAWIAARFADVEISRLVFLRRVVLAGALGLACTAPLLAAFADQLRISAIAMHDGSLTVATHPPLFKSIGLLQKFLPYAYGPIFASGQLDLFTYWGISGGYVGFGAASLSVLALFGTRQRALRIACFAALALAFGSIVGIPVLEHVVFAIPGVKYTNYWRYLDPVVSFTTSYLAATAIDDMIDSRDVLAAKMFAALLAPALLVTIGLVTAWSYLVGPASDGDRVGAGWHFFSIAVFGAVVIGLGAAAFVRPAARAAVAGVTVIAELAIFFTIPSLAYPPAATFSRGSIDYLQHNAGFSRVFTLGPLAANYGSYYGIALINYNDDPVPALTPRYVHEHLDPEADTYIFNGSFPRSGTSSIAEFRARVAFYERAGVKYVLSTPGTLAPMRETKPVYRDAIAQIDELRAAEPYVAADGCTVTASSRTDVLADCRGTSSLCRLELNLSGWTAKVNGREAALTTCGEIFQSVAMPAGRSRVTFSFEPPYVRAALICSALGVMIAIAVFVAAIRLWGRERSAQFGLTA